jgi:hypothetical protein
MFAANAKTGQPLTEEERSLVAFDLRIAAERYDENRKLMEESSAEAKAGGVVRQAEGFAQLAAQFERQAARARRFADLIEEFGGGL